MIEKYFKAIVTEETGKNIFSRGIRERCIEELPDGDVLIEVHYSSLNYKDALCARGHKGISRHFPRTPGIDAAGIVAESRSPDFNVGDKVLVTGYDLGMNTDGGFAEYIRVPEAWIVHLPDDLSLRESMIYGTAGFTAGICLHELEKHDIMPDSGKVLVTGASGGVGSLAVGMLARSGYDVVASTGKTDAHEMLRYLGAGEITGRDEINDKSGRPMLPGRWKAIIDTVGGNTLSTAVRSTKMHGLVCCLGNVLGDTLDVSVYPFLLRGVTIAGIDSAEKPMPLRLRIWERIVSDWRIENIDTIVKEVNLEQLDKEIDIILEGGQKGKVLVNIKS